MPTEPTPAADQPRWPSRYGWVFAAVWLVYLANPLGAITDADGWRQVLGYVGARRLRRALHGRDRLRPAGPADQADSVAALAQLRTGSSLARGDAGDGARRRGQPHWSAWRSSSAFAAMSLPRRWALATVAVLVGRHRVVVPAGLGVGGPRLRARRGPRRRSRRVRSGWRSNATRALLEAQEELAELAVEEERSRIARDLHDILGHSLTVITVKAELARRLLDVDAERTRAELADLEQLCRDALADVRATALGVRGVSLANEIARPRRRWSPPGSTPTCRPLPTRCRAVGARSSPGRSGRR